MKVQLPVFKFIGIIGGKQLLKNGINSCKGKKIVINRRYVCLLDIKKKKITPLRIADTKEK